MNFIILLLIIGLSAIDATFQSGWIQCASSGGYCRINSVRVKVNETNITNYHTTSTIQGRYGYGVQWSFRTFRYTNVFYCHSSNFGDPCTGVSGCSTRTCYYRHLDDDYIPYKYHHRYEINEKIINYDDKIRRLDYLDRSVMYYGGSITCKASLFYRDVDVYYNGYLTHYDPKDIYCTGYPEYDYTTNYTGWHICAEEGGECALPYSYNIFSISFGFTDWYNNASAVVREFSGNTIRCDNGVFPDDKTVTSQDFGTGTYRVCAYSISSQFKNPIGYWKPVASCANCSALQQTIGFGVSSTNANVESESWTDGLTESVNTGIRLGPFSGGTQLSESQRHTVTEQSSTAFSETFSRSCTAVCSPSGNQTNLYIYQWLIDVDQNCASDVDCNAKIYTCNYLCRHTTEVPMCIPGEC
jgi:hypothetical protein